jgi:formate-dependent nitrite reductase cytochrome c552 subunit
VSWFTVEAKSAQTACPRCKSAQFARLVKRGDLHDIFNCGKCETPKPERSNAQTAASSRH